ncbi:VOC family protein [Affinibrenneria salicis]|uniref:VOC family protein n=1 Tax=Affinibrenneria salicis TaxID=2590031 RepID=A0A5J5G6P3_9GAMM|nr:VOC family protein [Affinibrenneria salicis]KAA9002714.1 VOC family protein [Affinibrenneria salicis]KAA9002999.1 VOC family protein [Affinibrenneria salicis]
MILKLDHLVINSHFELDNSAQLFRALGFVLTPRGYHSLGSINHLIMFADHYLELIGLPERGEPLRRELLANPPGIDGLVFASDNAESTATTLRTAGFSVQPVQRFSREVNSGGEKGEARFSTVRLAPGSFSAGRVYFCQHHTPQWVWRDEWLQPGCIQALTVVARDADETGKQYARLGDTALLQVVSLAQWQAQYGDLLPLADDRESRFACIRIGGGDTVSVVAAAERFHLPLKQQDGYLRVAIPALALVLEFNDA